MISQNKACGKRIYGVENGWISLRIKGDVFHVFLIDEALERFSTSFEKLSIWKTSKTRKTPKG